MESQYLFFIITGIIIAVNISPRPGAWFINKQFDHPLTIREEESYQKARTNVEVMTNQEYTSSLEPLFLAIRFLRKPFNNHYRFFPVFIRILIHRWRRQNCYVLI